MGVRNAPHPFVTKKGVFGEGLRHIRPRVPRPAASAILFSLLIMIEDYSDSLLADVPRGPTDSIVRDSFSGSWPGDDPLAAEDTRRGVFITEVSDSLIASTATAEVGAPPRLGVPVPPPRVAKRRVALGANPP